MAFRFPLKHLLLTIHLFLSFIFTEKGVGQALNRPLHENLFKGPDFINTALSVSMDNTLPDLPAGVTIKFESTTKSKSVGPDFNYLLLSFEQNGKSISFLDERGTGESFIRYDTIIGRDSSVRFVTDTLINADGFYEKIIINGAGYQCAGAFERDFFTEVAEKLFNHYIIDAITNVCWKIAENEDQIKWESNLGESDVIFETASLNHTFFFTNGHLEKMVIRNNSHSIYLTRDGVRHPKYLDELFARYEEFLIPFFCKYLDKEFSSSSNIKRLKTYNYIKSKCPSDKNSYILKRFLPISMERGLGLNENVHTNLFSGPDFITDALTTPDEETLPPFPEKEINIYFCASTPSKCFGKDSNLVSVVFKDISKITGLFKTQSKTIEFLDAIDPDKKDMTGKVKTNCDGIFEKVIINGILHECHGELDKQLLTNVSARLISGYVSDALTVMTNEIKYTIVDSLDWFTNLTGQPLPVNEKEKLLVNGCYFYENGILKEINYYSNSQYITYFLISRNQDVFPKFVENYFRQIEEKIQVRVLEYTMQNEHFTNSVSQKNLLDNLINEIQK